MKEETWMILIEAGDIDNVALNLPRVPFILKYENEPSHILTGSVSQCNYTSLAQSETSWNPSGRSGTNRYNRLPTLKAKINLQVHISLVSFVTVTGDLHGKGLDCSTVRTAYVLSKVMRCLALQCVFFWVLPWCFLCGDSNGIFCVKNGRSLT